MATHLARFNKETDLDCVVSTEFLGGVEFLVLTDLNPKTRLVESQWRCERRLLPRLIEALQDGERYLGAHTGTAELAGQGRLF